MANNRCVYQQVTNVSVNKDKLLIIASDDTMSKKEYRLFLCLLTELNGWCPTDSGRGEDPRNFKKIDIYAISDVLGMKRKDVKKALEGLIAREYVEIGDSDTVIDGYRFTF